MDPWSEDLTRRQLHQFFEGLADGYSGHSSASLRVCVCVFITFVDYAYKNYTSPRSQRWRSRYNKGQTLFSKNDTTCRSRDYKRSCFYGLFRFCLTIPRITRSAHAIHHHRSQKTDSTERSAEQIHSTRLDRNSTLIPGKSK
ncbi:uncharacterized protein Dere_GG26285, isoform B [Drosophila erecta]|nr:uncharacterized protein Dere_GG26285, isoform A [Drosophila erecta]KQS38906.1 uncharacterized protein Dere_GG26285, isoform B [Drosophila erecta]